MGADSAYRTGGEGNFAKLRYTRGDNCHVRGPSGLEQAGRRLRARRSSHARARSLCRDLMCWIEGGLTPYAGIVGQARDLEQSQKSVRNAICFAADWSANW